MHIGVARADELVIDGIGRLTRHQQHGQAATKQIVHAICGICGANIDMHQHALAATGH